MGGGTFDLTYLAPSSANSGWPDSVTVQHIGQTGLRGGASEPRSASAIVRLFDVEITTTLGCLDPGSEPRQLEAVVEGGGDPDLTWSVSAGSISETGLFTPPSETGFVNITVYLTDHPEVADSIEVQVGGCTCTATASMDGMTAETSSLEFGLTSDLSALDYIAWSGASEGISSFTVIFVDPDFVRQTVPLNTTPLIYASASGFMQGVPFVTTNPADQIVSPLDVTLTRNDGSIVEGEIVGQVLVSGEGGEGLVSAPFSFRFVIAADPSISEDDVKYCDPISAGP